MNFSSLRGGSTRKVAAIGFFCLTLYLVVIFLSFLKTEEIEDKYMHEESQLTVGCAPHESAISPEHIRFVEFLPNGTSSSGNSVV